MNVRILICLMGFTGALWAEKVVYLGMAFSFSETGINSTMNP
jgi:hypothetical protein